MSDYTSLLGRIPDGVLLLKDAERAIAHVEGAGLFWWVGAMGMSLLKENAVFFVGIRLQENRWTVCDSEDFDFNEAILKSYSQFSKSLRGLDQLHIK